MTEKQFTLCEGTITGLKSCYEYDGMPLTHLQVLTLLNKLCDENKQLKEENEQLQMRTQPIVLDTHISDEDFERLEKLFRRLKNE